MSPAMAVRGARALPGAGRLLQILGLNGVPAAGFLADGWSIGTTLLLYWVETILVILLVALRIVLHRRLSRRAGHWNVTVTTTIRSAGATRVRHGQASFLASFLTIMVPFTLAHGLFVAILAFFVLPQELGGSSGAESTSGAAVVSLSDLRAGITGVAIFLAIGLAIDLHGLRWRPFHWIERVAELAQGRMFVTHLTILFGMFGMAMFGAPQALFIVFVALKTLMDLGAMLPERPPSPDPPRWLAWLDRLGPTKDGVTFSEHYRRSIAEDLARREANERELAPGASLA